MPNRAESWPPAPPPAVLDAIRKRLSPHAAERMDALRALRMTAIHADHAITAWLADTVGTRARWIRVFRKRSRCRIWKNSRPDTNEIARPLRPARPVRPMRWT